MILHSVSPGGHELEWRKKDPFKREGPQHKERNGYPVYFYCLESCKFFIARLFWLLLPHAFQC